MHTIIIFFIEIFEIYFKQFETELGITTFDVKCLMLIVYKDIACRNCFVQTPPISPQRLVQLQLAKLFSSNFHPNRTLNFEMKKIRENENKRNLIRVGPDRLADPSSVLHWSLPPSSASQTLKVKGRSKKGGKRFRLTIFFLKLKIWAVLHFWHCHNTTSPTPGPPPKCWQLFQLGNKIVYKTLKNGQNTQNFDSYV